MKGKCINTYRVNALTTMKVLAVSGTEEELELFKKIQSGKGYLKYEDNDESKSPLFFAPNANWIKDGQSVTLLVNYNKTNVRVDDSVYQDQREAAIDAEMIKLEAQQRFNQRMASQAMFVATGVGNVDPATGEVVTNDAQTAEETV